MLQGVLLSDRGVGRMKKWFLFCSLLLSCTVLHAGPFGLEMGWTIEECTDAGCLMMDTFSCIVDCRPPRPNTVFDSYQICIDEEFGVCRISAVSDAYESATYGYYVQYYFETVRDQLTAKYGEPRIFDHVHPTEPTDSDPQNWMRTLHEKKRVLFASWDDPKDPSLDSIWLEVESISPSSCKIRIEYLSPALISIRERTQQENYDAL